MSKFLSVHKVLLPLFFAVALTCIHPACFSAAHAQNTSYYYMPNDAPLFWSGPSYKQAVALTFDDGPDPMYTPQILSILSKHKVKATFFLVGEQTKRNLALVEKILAEGHEIGSHTMTHPDANNASPQQLQKEVLDSASLLQSVSTQQLRYLRPPYGHIHPSYFSACHDLGIKMILWSVDSNDWKSPPVDHLVKDVAGQLHPGSIVLFHDGGGVRQNTVEALDKLLPLLKQMKLEPVTLSQLLE